MKLTDLYSSYEAGDISLQQLAESLGFSERDMKFRLSSFGPRMTLLVSVLDRIADTSMTRTEAAEALGVSTRQVNHLMNTWKVVKPIPQYFINRTKSQVKWEIRKNYAVHYIAGSMPIDEAALYAGVSPRQMRRWVSELLAEHFGMVFKDLRALPERKRQRLANEIEEAEGLELAKQNVLKAVAEGERTLDEEAFDRAVHKRKRRQPNVRP